MWTLSQLSCATIVAVAINESVYARPAVVDAYNTIYGTAITQSELDGLQLGYDQLWIVGSSATFRPVGQFSAESISFGLYTDPGIASAVIQLRGPETHDNYLSDPRTAFPGSLVGSTIGLYLRSHIVPYFRISEDALNGPPNQGGPAGQDFFWAYHSPTSGTYLLCWEDYHGTGGDHDDLLVEIFGLTPLPSPGGLALLAVSMIVRPRRRRC